MDLKLFVHLAQPGRDGPSITLNFFLSDGLHLGVPLFGHHKVIRTGPFGDSLVNVLFFGLIATLLWKGSVLIAEEGLELGGSVKFLSC